jgi:hypothetical protein
MEIIFVVRGDTLNLTPFIIHMVPYATNILIGGGIFTKVALEGDISG